MQRRRARQHHTEFLAADTGQHVGRANLLQPATPHFLQHHVTRQVAIDIVHLLEVVEVEQDDGERLVRGAGNFDGARHEGVEGTFVGQTGQRVGRGIRGKFAVQARQIFAQTLFALDALGQQNGVADIRHERDHALQVPPDIQERHDGSAHPVLLTRLAPVAQGPAPGLTIPQLLPEPFIQFGTPQVATQDAVVGAGQLFRLVAIETKKSLVAA